MKSCLVVDDSRVIRKVARRILEDLDFVVEEAEHGAEALARCHRAMPNAILLDWNMPVMNGIDFTREVRRRGGHDQPRIVFCSTETRLDAIAEALEAGADEYIMKPFDAEIVAAKFAQAGLLQVGA